MRCSAALALKYHAITVLVFGDVRGATLDRDAHTSTIVWHECGHSLAPFIGLILKDSQLNSYAEVRLLFPSLQNLAFGILIPDGGPTITALRADYVNKQLRLDLHVLASCGSASQLLQVDGPDYFLGEFLAGIGRNCTQASEPFPVNT